MVSSVTWYSDPRNRAYPGTGYDGVVRVVVGDYYGTGTLLYDGHAVLTAAHLFPSGSATAHVSFETASGKQIVASSGVTVFPRYDAKEGNNDLALVWLGDDAPLAAERYKLYRASDEIGQTMTMVGYGVPGTGTSGTLDSYKDSPIRQKAENQFETDPVTLQSHIGSVMGWTATAGTQLLADFDSGSSNNDAFGRMMNRIGTGLGMSEGMITPGDSGGPAFIKGLVAGIASYTANLSTSLIHPDVDNEANSSYGEVGAWQRVSYYQQWIDQSLRAQHPNAPTKPEQVRQLVTEGNSGTSYAYFLLQFNGTRSNPTDLLSVDYATRDGSAKAGEDYLSTHGTLVLYPDETQAVIPVEIIGDGKREPDETFYMDVTHPVGGTFAGAQVTLVAMRTIVDDDASLLG